jgi:hypothetical protein
MLCRYFPQDTPYAYLLGKMVCINCWNFIKIVGDVFGKVATLRGGGGGAPLCWTKIRVFILTEQTAMMDKLLNTANKCNPLNPSGTSQAHVHTYIDGRNSKNHFSCSDWGGRLKNRKSLKTQTLSESFRMFSRKSQFWVWGGRGGHVWLPSFGIKLFLFAEHRAMTDKL